MLKLTAGQTRKNRVNETHATHKRVGVFQHEADFRASQCVDVNSRFLILLVCFLARLPLSGPMPVSDSKWANALSESSRLFPEGNVGK